MIAGEGRTVYVSGDTDVMADMSVLQDLHDPEIGILCAGGHFTMDMKRAAYAASKLFRFRTVIPVHYRTFPLLEQSADALKSALPGVRVLDPDPGRDDRDLSATCAARARKTRVFLAVFFEENAPRLKAHGPSPRRESRYPGAA
jgi:hypothetical protein